MKWLDSISERSARALARRTSRRSALGGLGSLLVGAAALPLLPVARGAERLPPAAGARPIPATRRRASTGATAPSTDSCAAAAAGLNPCVRRGTDMSPVTWIGTCHNPGDGKDYVISYNDCCGKSSCGRCFCNRNERDTSLFQPGQSNDYNWCSGNAKANIPYHCSTARIVGSAK